MDRAVDTLASGPDAASYGEVQRILADIRKQFDEVHCEAGKREQELLAIRRDIHLAEAEKRVVPDNWEGTSKEELQKRIEKVSDEIEEALETKQVYEHMMGRLKRELNIVKQKVKVLEDHARRKTTEVERKQVSSRRMHEEKISCINQLEAMEQDVEAERQVCQNALEDLEATCKLKQDEVRHREDFERWRYDVAAEAAGEAFKATAGRFWKIYAVEKLTGNCLQKITFEQLEQSQMTEDGFQKIREVTGLTDVMDIVHKFLHRDVEQEQLRVAVREAETRLYSLRESEAEAKQEHGELLSLMLESGPQEDPGRPRRLHVDVADHEQELANAVQGQEELKRQLRQGGLLFESVRQWTERIGRSMGPFEQLSRVEKPSDLPSFFAKLVETVDHMLDRARAELPGPRLAKAAGQASGRDRAEQLKLLTDKDFLRSNCRVPASLDANGFHDEPRRIRGPGHSRGKEDEGFEEEEIVTERDRLKEDSRKLAGKQDPRTLGQRRTIALSGSQSLRTTASGTWRMAQAFGGSHELFERAEPVVMSTPRGRHPPMGLKAMVEAPSERAEPAAAAAPRGRPPLKAQGTR